MLKLNRTTEYGLMALRHIQRRQSENALLVTSAREVADHYGLPFEITAKTLLKLKDKGMIQSAQGAKGGYSLSRQPSDITLREFLDAMEGGTDVVACCKYFEGKQDAPACEYVENCDIHGALQTLNGKYFEFLGQIKISELLN